MAENGKNGLPREKMAENGKNGLPREKMAENGFPRVIRRGSQVDNGRKRVATGKWQEMGYHGKNGRKWISACFVVEG